MWQEDLAYELSAAEPRSRAAIIDSYQRLTGKAPATLYRIAGKNGFESGRKTREDKGVLKSGITEDQVKYVSGLVFVTGRENKGPIMPVDEALEIAIDNGIIERGQISVDRMTAILRERQLDKKQMTAPTPHVEMRSLHPNYCHLADVSVCIQYYLKNGKMGIMDERDFYKNKPDAFAKIRQKLLRYVLDDHFSGRYLFRYYVAEGESRENLWDFLKWCWRVKTNPQLDMHGVPFFMLMDANSAQKSHAMQNFFKGLGVIIPKGKPYNPRRQGAVENTHNIIENRFETRLRIMPAFDVDQLNTWAEDYMIWHHAKRKHSRHGMTRLESWQLIQPEQLRIMPDDDILNILYVEPEVMCPVRNYRISYRGEEFNLKHLPGLYHNAKVAVRINPYRWKGEQIITVMWGDTPYEVPAIAKLDSTQGGFSVNANIIGQEYKAQPETPIQKSLKDIHLMAYGDRKVKKSDVPFEGTLVMGHQAEKVDNLAAMPKRGTTMEINRPPGEIRHPIMELFRRMRADGISITPDMNQQLRQRFGDSIAAADLDAVIQQYGANPAQAPAGLTLVVNR